MEKKNEDDGEGAQTVDVGPVAPIGLAHASAHAKASSAPSDSTGRSLYVNEPGFSLNRADAVGD